jgi:acetyl/propionyl-CoA carboxylase alpha subunit
MAQAAVALASACDYEGAGTVEFLYDTQRGEFYFLEMNTRIQVEHPVTEMVTHTDLVAAQLRLALGDTPDFAAASTDAGVHGHAVEARIYAENPLKQFLPSPGPLSVFEVPDLPGVRIDTGYRQGNTVTPFYDPMVAKVIAHGTSRDEAITRLGDALGQFRIEGIRHNIDYLRATLAHPAFIDAQLHTGFLAEHHAELLQTLQAAPTVHGHAAVAQ